MPPSTRASARHKSGFEPAGSRAAFRAVNDP
jgi:hypothetical protein